MRSLASSTSASASSNCEKVRVRKSVCSTRNSPDDGGDTAGEVGSVSEREAAGELDESSVDIPGDASVEKALSNTLSVT